MGYVDHAPVRLFFFFFLEGNVLAQAKEYVPNNSQVLKKMIMLHAWTFKHQRFWGNEVSLFTHGLFISCIGLSSHI